MTSELQDKIERYETNAAECDLIARLATDQAKRALYARLAVHCREVAADLAKLGEVRNAASREHFRF